MEKAIIALVAFILGALGFVLGRRSKGNVGPGDTAGAIGDIRETAVEVGAIGNEASDLAAESGELARRAGIAAGKLSEAATETARLGAEASGGREDSLRAGELIGELIGRHGKGAEEN